MWSFAATAEDPEGQTRWNVTSYLAGSAVQVPKCQERRFISVWWTRCGSSVTFMLLLWPSAVCGWAAEMLLDGITFHCGGKLLPPPPWCCTRLPLQRGICHQHAMSQRNPHGGSKPPKLTEAPPVRKEEEREDHKDGWKRSPQTKLFNPNIEIKVTGKQTVPFGIMTDWGSSMSLNQLWSVALQPEKLKPNRIWKERLVFVQN